MADRKKRRRQRRRSGFVEIANALLGLVVLGLLAAGGALYYGAQQFYAPGPVREDTTFVVVPYSENGAAPIIMNMGNK